MAVTQVGPDRVDEVLQVARHLPLDLESNQVRREVEGGEVLPGGHSVVEGNEFAIAAGARFA